MLLFLVTPCVVEAVQPCMEWIPIKRKYILVNWQEICSKMLVRGYKKVKKPRRLDWFKVKRGCYLVSEVMVRWKTFKIYKLFYLTLKDVCWEVSQAFIFLLNLLFVKLLTSLVVLPYMVMHIHFYHSKIIRAGRLEIFDQRIN